MHIVGYPVEAKASEVDAKFNPKHWNYALSNVEKAYTSDSPTLYGYAKKFGSKCAAAWVYMQVLALYGASINKDVNVGQSIISFAETFSTQVKGFRLSELMVFFARYRAGKYDNSYASFDSRRIGNAFFKEFLPERNQELAAIERKRLKERIAKSRFCAPKGYTSLTLYQEIKKLSDTGLYEAREYLQGKRHMTEEELINLIEENKQK